MSITIDATYEDGVLKPSQPLPLREHETVRLTLEVAHPNAADKSSTQNAIPSARPSLAEKILSLTRDLPDEVVNAWPTDGASQHDHYLYGAPKRAE